MEGSSSLYLTILPGLLAIGIVASRDHVFKVVCDLMDLSLL